MITGKFEFGDEPAQYENAASVASSIGRAGLNEVRNLMGPADRCIPRELSVIPPSQLDLGLSPAGAEWWNRLNTSESSWTQRPTFSRVKPHHRTSGAQTCECLSILYGDIIQQQV